MSSPGKSNGGFPKCIAQRKQGYYEPQRQLWSGGRMSLQDYTWDLKMSWMDVDGFLSSQPQPHLHCHFMDGSRQVLFVCIWQQDAFLFLPLPIRSMFSFCPRGFQVKLFQHLLFLRHWAHMNDKNFSSFFNVFPFKGSHVVYHAFDLCLSPIFLLCLVSLSVWPSCWYSARYCYLHSWNKF